jgi:hypothetical protein
MNIFLFVVYFVIVFGTIILTAILVKYLNEKALQKQQLRDEVLSDLAIISGGLVVIIAGLIVIREIIGPFHSVKVVAAFFVFLQYHYDILLSCIVSLQLTQLLSVFFAAELSEWREDLLVTFHRLFTFVLGFFTAGLVCHFKGGMCRPTSLYYYVLQEYQEEDANEAIIQLLMLVIFVATICICQAMIEIKRFIARRAENKVDVLAIYASKQIEEATKRFKNQKPVRADENFLPGQVNVTIDDVTVSPSSTAKSTHSQLGSFKGSVSPINSNQFTSFTANSKSKSKSSKEQAVKIARFVCFFGVLPALVTVMNLSISNSTSYKPHGATIVFLLLYGIFIPTSIILSNKKTSAFAKTFLNRNTFGLMCKD